MVDRIDIGPLGGLVANVEDKEVQLTVALEFPLLN